MKICLDMETLVVRSPGTMMTKENFNIFVWGWNLVRLGISVNAFVACFKVKQVLYDIGRGSHSLTRATWTWHTVGYIFSLLLLARHTGELLFCPRCPSVCLSVCHNPNPHNAKAAFSPTNCVETKPETFMSIQAFIADLCAIGFEVLKYPR